MKQAEVPYDELVKAYRTSASVVKIHGEHYLPVFERLHREVQTRQTREELLSRALEIAGD